MNPKYSNTKTHYKLYYVEDFVYLDYQSWRPVYSAMPK
jgi:hypothetical protein